MKYRRSISQLMLSSSPPPRYSKNVVFPKDIPKLFRYCELYVYSSQHLDAGKKNKEGARQVSSESVVAVISHVIIY